MFNLPPNPFAQIRITSVLEHNKIFMKTHLTSSDIVFRELMIGNPHALNGLIVCIEGLIDKKIIQQNVIQPLQQWVTTSSDISVWHKVISSNVLQTVSVSEEVLFEVAVDQLLRGQTLLFVEGIASVFVIDTQEWKMRNITEPITETIIRGPREGFVETLRVNTSLLRRKINHPALTIYEMEMGTITKTKVAIAYLEGYAPHTLINEIKQRLQKVQLTQILESNYIEECIEDSSFNLFPTIGNSERPDVVAAKLLEGRVAVFVDGSSSVLTAPLLFFDLFKMPEDYYSRSYYISFIRIIRFFGFVFSTMGPALYLAFMSFQEELIPTALFISFIISRSDVPFTLLFELFALLIVFEVLKEVGTRIPTPIGQTIPLIGGIVLGEAAVRAGFVAESSLIVAVLSGFIAYLVPALSQVNTLLRFVYLIIAELFGMYGVSLLFIFFLIYTANIQSCGYYYMSPYYPVYWKGWRDFLIRIPLRMLNRKPQILTKVDALHINGYPSATSIDLDEKVVNTHEQDHVHTPPTIFQRIVHHWMQRK